MTSGAFKTIPLSSIQVNREERQRRELPNIDILADSIRRLGLIHPLVVDEEHNLVAGERRLEALKSLGWTDVPIQYLQDLDPLIRHAIELEENIKREALPWQDECRAIAEYHALRASQEPEWSQEKTGEALGLSRTHVLEKIKVAEELARGNSMVTQAPRLSVARGIVRRAEARKADAEIHLLATPAPKEIEAPAGPILNEDFNTWSATYTGPKFNFIHCDFPYGINADKFNQGAAKLHGGYDDSEDTYWNLCASLAANLDRVAQPSCHIMFWFSMHFYAETLKFFEDHTDFIIDPFPLIWVKSDNIGIIPDPERGPRRIYEAALFGARGDRKIVRSSSNAAFLPSTRDEHMSIKSEDMLRKFFTMFVDESTVFLDPTCGSGSSVRAAAGLGARLVRGLEINPGFAERANINFNKGAVNADRAGVADAAERRNVESDSSKLAAD